MASTFPRISAYLRGLPRGLASYPAAASKASLYVSAIKDKPLAPFVDSLPREVVYLVQTPLLMSSWAPSVHVQAIFLAIADAHGMDDAQFQEWSFQLQRSLFASPFYRAIAALASPALLLAGASKRWSAFHKGTEMEAQRVSADQATIRLRHPPNMYAQTNLVGFAGGIAAVAQLSQASQCTVKVVSRRPGEAVFEARWQE